MAKKSGLAVWILSITAVLFTVPSAAQYQYEYQSSGESGEIYQTSIELSEPVPVSAVESPVGVELSVPPASNPTPAPTPAASPFLPEPVSFASSPLLESETSSAESPVPTAVPVPPAPTFASPTPTPAAVPADSSISQLTQRIEKLEAQLQKEKDKSDKKKADDASKPSVKVSGRIHMDADVFDQDDASKARAGDMRDGAELRRAWIGVSGKYNQFRYKCDVDLAPSSVSFKDVYVGMDSLPILCDFRAGYYKEPVSVDQLVGVHQMWFIDRPVCMSGISSYMDNRSLGVSFRNASRKENLLWNFGFYQSCSDTFHKHYDEYSSSDASNKSGKGFTGRLAYLFYDDPCNGGNLHLGASFTYKGWDSLQKMNWGTKPEGDMGGKVLETGDFYGTTDTYMIAPEFIYTQKSFALQAEYHYVKLKNQYYNDPEFHGGWVAVSYLLTGEYYNYVKGDGVLSYIKPNRDFARICKDGQFVSGPGAWQALYRFSWIDYSQMPLQSGSDAEKSKIGVCYDHTFGLNWQMTQNVRLMFNYILSNNQYKYGTLNTDGAVHVGTMSFQMYF